MSTFLPKNNKIRRSSATPPRAAEREGSENNNKHCDAYNHKQSTHFAHEPAKPTSLVVGIQNPTKTDGENRKLLDKSRRKRYSCNMAMCAQISLQIRSNPLAEDTARWLICTEQPSTTSKHKSFLPHGIAVKGLFASRRSMGCFVTRKKQFAGYFAAAYARVRDFLQINFCQAAG